MRALIFCLFMACPAQACETALLLLIDTSSSIDAGEYAQQSGGTADAIEDPEIMAELVRGKVALSVLHWSGQGQLAEILPWRQVGTFLDPPRIADIIRRSPRAYRDGPTAPGDALAAAIRAFDDAPACDRQVIDISTDGMRNDGRPVAPLRRLAQTRGIQINGIAIETVGQPITRYLLTTVVTQGGFVVTARFYNDYPRAIRAKILREISRVMM